MKWKKFTLKTLSEVEDIVISTLAEAGVEGVIVDKNNKIRLLEGSYTLKKKDQVGDFVSLIPITRALKGVTLRGFKYPLERHTTYFGESLCVSNELEAEEGFINIEEGMAFLIESRD